MIKIEIKTDNAAFEGNNHYPEITWVLRQLATKISLIGDQYQGDEHIEGEWPLLDSNGNNVGFCKFSDGEDDSENPGLLP